MASTTQQAALGAALRRARTIRGQSLDGAARRTRISASYLEALENDAPLDSFPSPTYARLFLRSYARHLGLNEEAAVRAFALLHGDGGPGREDLRAGRQRLSTGLRPGPAAPVTGGVSPMRRISPVARLRKALAGRRSRRIGPGRRQDRPALAPAVVAATAVLAAVLLAAALFVGARHHRSPVTAPRAVRTADLPQLPIGGRQILPKYRVVAYYGTARTARLGVLGEGTPDQQAAELLKQARRFHYDRPILPVFELIATVATYHPGPDGKYRFRQPADVVQRYLEAVRRIKGLLVLDIQPGRADFMPEVKAYRRFLQEPDVGLALDGEWHVRADQVPGVHIGSIEAATVNQAELYLSEIVRRYKLPQKLFVIHQFTPSEVRNKVDIGRTPPGLAVVLDIDGFGRRDTKISKYNQLTGMGDGFYHGVKLYYRQDIDLMTPEDVLGLRPTPDVVIYQ